MRNHDALSVFIYVLVAELFLYFVASFSMGNLLGGLGDLFFAAALCITLLGILVASYRHGSRKLRFFYYLLWIVSLIFVYLYIFHYGEVQPFLKYYFMLAVLVALLVSILDRKVHGQRKYIVVKSKDAEMERQRRLSESIMYQREIDEQNKRLEDLKAYTEKLRSVKAKYQQESEDKLLKLAKAREELDRQANETQMVGKRLADGVRYKEELDKKDSMLADKNRKMQEDRQKLSELQKKNDALRKVLNKAIGEAEKQSELKQKYSKTLTNIRKAKKEEEALLVVSPDGKSVHRPACIAVRTISKENRRLIPNWKEAKAEGYKGCKLCKPHEENDYVIRDGVKYRFVVSRDSDKIHKTNCTVLKSISDSDKVYLKSYKSAVKKGYTPCRVCNPKQ